MEVAVIVVVAVFAVEVVVVIVVVAVFAVEVVVVAVIVLHRKKQNKQK